VQGNLDAIEDADEKSQVLLTIAEALAPHDAPEAKKWLALARAAYPNLKEGWQKKRADIKLAVVAARLGEADADEWFDKSLKAASRRPRA
jgi:hypothetical protein